MKNRSPVRTYSWVPTPAAPVAGSLCLGMWAKNGDKNEEK